MPTPVAKIGLDTRSWGPESCRRCDEEVEDVVLMSDGSFACADCLTPMEGDFWENLAGVFTSAECVVKK